MENQQIVYELLKGFGVLFFLALFYIVFKKANTIARSFEAVLKGKGIEINKEYRKKILGKVIINQISFKPFNQSELENYLEKEILDSKEFKSNVILSKELEI